MINKNKLLIYTDIKGNKYYLINNTKRVVEYQGIPDPASIDPKIHAWLHYLSDDVLDVESNMKPNLNNLTGYKKPTYIPWKPN